MPEHSAARDSRALRPVPPRGMAQFGYGTPSLYGRSGALPGHMGMGSKAAGMRRLAATISRKLKFLLSPCQASISF
ncbi:hypothetical protein RB195_002660 [Necator americanus]|uniref:Uncharacterized protein n=1 Tax=Necator americanus TaxID=51031 RepID=A0ABR1DK29_NECAM